MLVSSEFAAGDNASLTTLLRELTVSRQNNRRAPYTKDSQSPLIRSSTFRRFLWLK
jgi:hypothetical protein